MKTYLIGLALIAVACTPRTADAGCGQGQGHCGGGGACLSADLPREELSEAETASLLLMREEEKLARDVYLTLGKTYDLDVFVNIPRAEQRHMDRVGDLLAKYEIADPIGDATVGQFTNPKLQALYNDLVARGQTSVTAALQVGATIEDLDLFDLQQALAHVVDNADIQQVYANLAKGSRNHMRAFTAQLAAHDATYEAQHITAADYAAIVASDWERGPAGEGRGRGKGHGKGKGQGKGMGQGRGHGQGRCCEHRS
jgi:hypothetical protein